MPTTRSQAARQRGQPVAVDPPSILTVIDIIGKVTRLARGMHFVAATIEDLFQRRVGFCDAIQASGSRSVVTARRLRYFHEARWGAKEDDDGMNVRRIDYGAESDDDEDYAEEIEHEVEWAFDEDYSVLRAVEIVTEFEETILNLLEERTTAMRNLRDPDGAAFLEPLATQCRASIEKWERVKEGLEVCDEEGGEAFMDMALAKDWLK